MCGWSYHSRCCQVADLVGRALDAPHKTLLLSETQLSRVNTQAGRAVLEQSNKPHGYSVDLGTKGWDDVLVDETDSTTRDLVHRLLDPIGEYCLITEDFRAQLWNRGSGAALSTAYVARTSKGLGKRHLCCDWAAVGGVACPA